MTVVTDTKGRRWSIEYDHAAIERFQAKTGRRINTPLGLLDLMLCPDAAGDLFWELVGGHAQDQGVSQAELAAALDTESVGEIFKAIKSMLLGALPAKRRPLATRVLAYL